MAVFVVVDSVVVGAAGCVANCYYSDSLAWTTDRYVESVVWLMRLVVDNSGIYLGLQQLEHLSETFCATRLGTITSAAHYRSFSRTNI